LLKDGRPVREAAGFVAASGEAQSQGEIGVLLNPQVELGGAMILADGAGNGGPNQLPDNSSKVIHVRGREQQLHVFLMIKGCGNQGSQQS
jgi:hypothetical protein